MQHKRQYRRSKKKGTIWMTGGLLLLAAALFLTAWNLYEGEQAGDASDEVVERLTDEIETRKQDEHKEQKGQQDTNKEKNILSVEEIPDYVLYPEKEMPEIEIDGNRYIGILQVPALDLQLPVMAGEWTYPKLRIAPCRYSGSVYQDNLVVAAHNYTRHFGNLRGLPVGTEISFTDADGNLFEYEIAWIETLGKYDGEDMVSGDDWDLTLFTCVYSGRQRYTIRCVRKDSAT